MRIDKDYDDIINDLRKTRGGFYPPNQFCKDAYRAELDAFNAYFEGYSATQTLHDALSPFKVPVFVFTPSASAKGLVTMPDDYAHFLSGSVTLFSNTSGKKREAIRIKTEDERDAALSNQVRVVSASKPIAVEGYKSLQLYPEVPMSGELYYLRLPKYPVYNYTTIGNSRKLVYVEAGSQDVEFADLYRTDILDRIRMYANRYLDEQMQKTA